METTSKALLQIALAEDNPADVALVRLSLRAAGVDCVVTVVDDGDKAISLIDQFGPGSKGTTYRPLILDMHLPKRDGRDVLNDFGLPNGMHKPRSSSRLPQHRPKTTTKRESMLPTITSESQRRSPNSCNLA